MSVRTKIEEVVFIAGALATRKEQRRAAAGPGVVACSPRGASAPCASKHASPPGVIVHVCVADADGRCRGTAALHPDGQTTSRALPRGPSSEGVDGEHRRRQRRRIQRFDQDLALR